MTPQFPDEPPFGRVMDAVRHGTMPMILQSLANKGDIAVASFVDENSMEFSCRQNAFFTCASRLEIGCIVKTLTALLVAYAVAERRISFHDPVQQYFPNIGGIDPSLMMFHLLNQSHGLDGSTMKSMPQGGNGYIKADVIWREVQKERVTGPPGAFFYNYGTAGSWIAAAILEAVYDVPYWKLLNAKVLAPIGASLTDMEGKIVCPASGGISLSANELLRICTTHLRGNEPLVDVLGEARSYEISVPTWPLLGDTACPGWFRQGSAYAAFGYYRNESALMMVISPTERAGLVVSSRQLNVIYLIRRTLFESWFRTSSISFPRPLTKLECRSLQKKKFVGRYQKGSLLLEVSCSPDGKILAAVYKRDLGGTVEEKPLVTRPMMPAVANTLLPVFPEQKLISVLRFFQEMSDGEFEYAANGKHVFRRI